MQVVERIRSSCTFQVHKVTRMSGEGFLIKRSLMCTKILLMIYSFSVTSRRGPPTSRRQFDPSLSRCDVALNVATSNFSLSTTSRRGPPTSRRQFDPSLPRRDVDFQRRDVDFHDSLSRRDVVPHIATSFNYMLFHIATLNRTSRRWL